MIIYSCAKFDIMKKMYENLTEKTVLIDCGEELGSKQKNGSLYTYFNSSINGNGWTNRTMEKKLA